MKVKGIALVLGDEISTDAIIAGKYCRMADPARLAPHALEGVVPKRLPLKGRVLVAGQNFGVGSSREQAPLALRAAGVKAVVAGSFGRIFFRNAINLGLPVLKCPGAHAAARDGETVTVDLTAGRLRCGRGAPALECERLPPYLLEILEDGGLVVHLRKRFSDGKT